MTDERLTSRASDRVARRGLWAFALIAVTIHGAVPARGQVAVKGQGFVPYREAPIHYLADPVDDPVTKLQTRLDKKEVSLAHEDGRGYLKAVLDALEIPVSSQSLVFSKTSFQYRRISPTTPRALYFNDDVYIGYVQGAKVLEVASFDPKQGAIFYLLDQEKSEEPTFLRAELDCTQCHVAPGTRGVPGVLVRSIVPSKTGTQVPRTEGFVTGHESPWVERFGGWYVTGSSGARPHMGNAVAKDPENPTQLAPVLSGDVAGLAGKVDTSPFLSGHSDLVAQMVLAHQTQAHNLITLVNYRTRIALHEQVISNQASGKPADFGADAAREKFEEPAEELVKYLLFADEASLPAPVSGSSDFAKEFAARGPRDPKGRSLRDFDLQTRLFKYPCSYLIYTRAFDALPDEARAYVYRRLREVLTGQDTSPTFVALSSSDRAAILEILLATKPGLPDDWRTPSPAAPDPGRCTER